MMGIMAGLSEPAESEPSKFKVQLGLLVTSGSEASQEALRCPKQCVPNLVEWVAHGSFGVLIAGAAGGLLLDS
jgi:hypothetical protein